MKYIGIAADEKTAAALPGTKVYSAAHASAADIPEFSDLVAMWAEELHSLGRDFAAGRICVDPKNIHQTCEYCEVSPLCRIHERDAASREED